MQIHITTRNRNFASRKTLCLEAVQFGNLSGDPFLDAAALFWHGDTYVYCYHRPQKAIDIFKDSMKDLGGSMLLKSKLSMNLAIAHAQQGDETSTLNCVEQAIKAVPKYPEQDPAYPYVDITQGKLEKQMGRVYLALAEHLPGYAKKARDFFEEGISKCRSNQGDLSQSLIHKADATRIIGDLHEYAKSLSDGMRIAVHIGSKNQQHEAIAVLSKAPENWQKEQKYQDLVKLF
jgi:tetratricopeptide (TPR) repeat protein